MRLMTTSILLAAIAALFSTTSTVAQDSCAIQVQISIPAGKIPLTCSHNGHWNIYGTTWQAQMSINGSDWQQPSAGYTGLATLDMSFYVNNNPATLNITLISNVYNSTITGNEWTFTLGDYQPLFSGSIDLGYYGCRYDTPKPNITVSMKSVASITAGTFGEFTCIPSVVNALDKSNNRDYVGGSGSSGSNGWNGGSSSSHGINLSLGAIVGIAVGLLFLIVFGVTCGLAYKVLVVDRRAEKKQVVSAVEKKESANATPAAENKTPLVEQPKPVEMEAVHVNVEEPAAAVIEPQQSASAAGAAQSS